jgi:Glycosyl hydrolase family 76
MSDPSVSPEAYAGRAVRAYRAMRRRFSARRGGYRRDGRRHLPGAAAHLWPFIRAFAGVLDLTGAHVAAAEGFDGDAAIAEHLEALDRYWDPQGPWPAYSSDVAGTWWGGDRYYDDNAWVGLVLVQLERTRPGAGRLDRAVDLFRFAVDGWDRRRDAPAPGGVFWVEQGRGVGRRNHDRNTVSSAPNAQLGLHLAELGADLGRGRPDAVGSREMYEWVNRELDAAGRTADTGGDVPGTGLFWDKIRGDGSIDRALWSYNQGSMIGLNVLLARAGGGDSGTHTSRAIAIARKALRHYGGAYERQPPAFNAIFFRNLLQLHAHTADTGLRADIIGALRGYADHAWAACRDGDDCFRFPGRPPSLLDQSAMVQLLALLAWSPDDYARLA